MIKKVKDVTTTLIKTKSRIKSKTGIYIMTNYLKNILTTSHFFLAQVRINWFQGTTGLAFLLQALNHIVTILKSSLRKWWCSQVQKLLYPVSGVLHSQDNKRILYKIIF